jgi:hypothetical protein
MEKIIMERDNPDRIVPFIYGHISAFESFSGEWVYYTQNWGK